MSFHGPFARRMHLLSFSLSLPHWKVLLVRVTKTMKRRTISASPKSSLPEGHSHAPILLNFSASQSQNHFYIWSRLSRARVIDTDDFELILICLLFRFESVWPPVFPFDPPRAKFHRDPWVRAPRAPPRAFAARSCASDPVRGRFTVARVTHTRAQTRTSG